MTTLNLTAIRCLCRDRDLERVKDSVVLKNEGVVKWYHAGLQNQKQEFDSPHLCQNNTPLAQWLEQNAHNVLVTGSSPVGSTKCGCSIMVLLQISNLKIGVRFPSSAPNFKEGKEG